MDTYAEVILPLPLYSTYTYAVPHELSDTLARGSRVYVQFGPKKFYTGIVESLHDTKPEGYEIKPIVAILDNEPVVKAPQIRFWKWISDYYLCSVGEVYKAAIPAGLKVESETVVSLNKDYEAPEGTRFTERETLLLMALKEDGHTKVAELERRIGISNLTPTINSLLRQTVVEIAERASEKYRPQTETMVRLTAEPGDHDSLHRFFDLVSRSRRQEKLLVAYLDLSGWMRPASQPREVNRRQLIETSDATPGIFKALVDKGIFETYKRTVNRFKESFSGTDTRPASLSDAQSDALASIREEMRSHQVTLLHGVTGSGKTEIYTHLISEALRQGSSVLYLVPEISLTTQLTDRLRKVFGDKLVVYHSKFTDNERVDIWNRLLHSSAPTVVLGVRSSVFLPFAHLGLVIVDEEHEPSYKQYDPAPRYNARDAAIVLAAMHGAKTLLGSGTPSIETYYKATNGKFGLVLLNERYSGAVLPDVEIIDMRQQRKQKTVKGIMSEPLRSATRRALEAGGQAIMFQNRRGFAPVVMCYTCGWTPRCINCDVSLVYHKNQSLMRCHYCGYSAPLPTLCPACGENAIRTLGYGTERIAEELHQEFDGYRVSRMDLDTTRNRESYHEIIDEFANHETDILVGTQMVTKGLDFAKVSLVGVLSADTLLNFPDFRSNERAFNMLEQVAGRAGRRLDKGLVLIQTTQPDDPILADVRAHDFAGYYMRELATRKQYFYPPFSRVINIYLKHKDAATVDAIAVKYALMLREVFGDRVLGPDKPYVSRVSTWWIQSIMLKVEDTASMVKVKQLLREIFTRMATDSRMRGTAVYYDVDPV